MRIIGTAVLPPEIFIESEDVFYSSIAFDMYLSYRAIWGIMSGDI
ncbi:MAG: hypothetical protein ABIM30_09810 [candidate division WOR-3 bacterium]